MDLSVVFGLYWVSTTKLAIKGHDNQVLKVRNVSLTYLHLSRHQTSMTRYLYECSLFVQKVFFLKWLIEIQLYPSLALLCPFYLFLGQFLWKTYPYQLVYCPFEVEDLNTLIWKRVILVFHIRISTWISDSYCEWQLLSF